MDKSFAFDSGKTRTRVGTPADALEHRTMKNLFDRGIIK
jgi:hypothetical protein